MRIRVWAVLGGLLAGTVVCADEADQAIRKTLHNLQPDTAVESIVKSPVVGLYQVSLKGGQQLYATADGQYLLHGYLYQYQNGDVVNLTEQAQAAAIAKAVADVPDQDMVIFAAAVPKTSITVFTDTDCPYCQKLHEEIPELNKRGVTVRYLAFPRQGLKSHGAETLESVWCAKDRQKAMDLAKARKEVPKVSCASNPIAREYALGQSIGIQGTPAVILGNGQMIPGDQPAAILADHDLKAAH